MFGLRRAAIARAAGPVDVTGYTLRDFREKVHAPSASQLTS